MREIKFRAWNPETKSMNEVMMLGDKFCSVVSPFSIAGGSAWDRDKLILMQYTGLHDKNGKEIYEGDILQGIGEYARNVDEVRWTSGRFVRYGKYNGGNSDIDINHGLASFEVIGNIYENPELLNDKKLTVK